MNAVTQVLKSWHQVYTQAAKTPIARMVCLGSEYKDDCPWVEHDAGCMWCAEQRTCDDYRRVYGRS